jgi:RNA-binding protein NOB1
LPKGGKKANDIILREDQKEYQRALKTAAVKKKQMASIDLFDPDYSLMEGSLRTFNYGPQIGYGRKNPNESRRKRR